MAENLRINGALLIDNIHGHEWRRARRRQCRRVEHTGFKAGEVVLTGNVQELAVAGQEFYIDNVCVIAGEETACAAAGCRWHLRRGRNRRLHRRYGIELRCRATI